MVRVSILHLLLSYEIDPSAADLVGGAIIAQSSCAFAHVNCITHGVYHVMYCRMEILV